LVLVVPGAGFEPSNEMGFDALELVLWTPIISTPPHWKRLGPGPF
jgi:hypothetical protein